MATRSDTSSEDSRTQAHSMRALRFVGAWAAAWAAQRQSISMAVEPQPTRNHMGVRLVDAYQARVSPTSGPTKISVSSLRVNNFDLIRFFAALQVVVAHGAYYLHAPIWNPVGVVLGFLPGVPIFFVISGFLISLSWERAPSPASYVRNRLLRIYPALWVCLAISILIFLSAGVRAGSVEFTTWLAAQATIVQFYNPAFLRPFGIGVLNGSLWTIPVELQFYVLLPFLALVARKHPSRWLLLSIVAAVAMIFARTGLGVRDTMLQKLLAVSIVPYLFYFLVGVLMRYAYERHPAIFRGQAFGWIAVYAIWALIEVHFSIPGANGNLLNVVSLILIATLIISGAFSAPALSRRVLRGNDISYGMYIYHAPILNLLVAHQIGGGRGFALFFVTVVIFAFLSWRLVEKPMLSLKRNPLRTVHQ